MCLKFYENTLKVFIIIINIYITMFHKTIKVLYKIFSFQLIVS